MPGALFPTMLTITFRPQSRTCPRCGVRGKVLKTKTTKVATLAIGEFSAREFRYSCPRCGLVIGSEELRGLVAKGCNNGYDVLVHVGEAFFLGSHDNEQIVDELREKNVFVCRSEISYLAKKFIVYLALLHKRVQKQTRAFLSMNGGYVLHLDGTCEGESPHLISVLDGITEIVLDNTKLPSENADDLIPFLQGIRTAYGEPVAVVTDMGKGFLAAIAAVFAGVPLFVCHYHFLRSVGKELLSEENDTIRKRLSRHGIQGVLRRRVRALNDTIAGAPRFAERFLTGIETEEVGKACAVEGLPQLVVHTLLVWALEGKSQGQGRGFPFDQPYLTFYRRLVTAGKLLDQFSRAGLFAGAKDRRLYSTVGGDLLPVTRDSMLKRAAAKMEEKVGVFDRLRTAMRITLDENKRALNDDGELCDMKTIEKEVSKFRRQVTKDNNRMKEGAYRKMIGQIDKYHQMLFCDPIVAETKAGRIIIQPQRTNNILEQFFRTLMRTYRKKNGFQAMEKALKAMLKDTPLVMNLRNEDFMEVLLSGKSDLAQRFADIDAEIVRQELNRSTGQGNRPSARLKKIIGAPTFLESLTSLVTKMAS